MVSKFCQYCSESLSQTVDKIARLRESEQIIAKEERDERTKTVSLCRRHRRRRSCAGAKGAFVAPYTIPNKSHAHPDYDRFWAVAQELEAPVGIHTCSEPPAKRVHQRFKDMQRN